MTFNKLCSLVAKKEGKKKQVSIGNVREVIAVLIDLEAKNMASGKLLYSGPMFKLMRIADQKARRIKNMKAKKK